MKNLSPKYSSYFNIFHKIKIILLTLTFSCTKSKKKKNGKFVINEMKVAYIFLPTCVALPLIINNSLKKLI